jgi:hypothetical protein
MAVLQNSSPTTPSCQDNDLAPPPVVMRSRPVLSKKAIQIMEAWYHDNINHPYPNHSTIKNMAQQASLKEEQVRKWFGNKRNRCRNARPYNKKQKLTTAHVQCMLWFCNCAIIVIINRKVLFYELFFCYCYMKYECLLLFWNKKKNCTLLLFLFFNCFPIAGLIVGIKHQSINHCRH